MKVLLLTGVGALFFAYYWADNFDPASLQGARVLLTGASAGVGEELAYCYARLGSHLVLTAHTEALLQKVVGNCRKLGAPKVFYIAADMASAEVPERVVRFALDKLGGLDYLVLNHLGAAPAGTRARSAQAARWLMQVNFLSYVQLTSLALPSLTESRGSLVVVSSLLGRVPRSFSSPYSAAKFAVDSFFASLRRELDVQDVNVAITMCVLGLWDRASAAEGVSCPEVRTQTETPLREPSGTEKENGENRPAPGNSENSSAREPQRRPYPQRCRRPGQASPPSSCSSSASILQMRKQAQRGDVTCSRIPAIPNKVTPSLSHPWNLV
ncbi:hydroxysteroid 11-beta-dehydrogenase 1-like protein isoform X1 [Rousettus aegyptiacus]|uniref:hydroxysteroid 11-beta-dehydrogenase 1-like protein isoform X1 n=1 Tax=Rousettus aegyptiacus TaxID=9407 RepID=UPI00168D91C9|nr:hydroxysteroid 11-beta-dehydrogenase 1-like protein isoform X1 [Rousettus aegyptiacus]XP_016000370.2 hydroxysteroid 11-beta-dehydrogenase 1-like protein isoform X1 [Rousettus aegyptiacus]XP_016000380.2 hydroxysteroid 11-beta-dehydrogenase 1-like protein isoform X1 [Rousettus aegyptiacus]XP_016000388.2 hydroxysteroid 11-beta-dehydrogenase 1-like protein isoform X1 [Rousettus aegyptiacus]